MIAKLARDSKSFVGPTATWDKIDEIIERLNWLLDIMPCHFKDGMCVIHNSPQVYLEEFDTPRSEIRVTDFCGVAQQKMKARIETNLNQL